jgi:hypothetical protein
MGDGRVLVSEYAQVTQRGRVVGAVQTAWSVGYALVLVANTVTLSLAPPELGARPDYPRGRESGEGNARRFFCCAKDQRRIQHLRKRGRFIIRRRGNTVVSLLKRPSAAFPDFSSGPD